MNTSQVLKPIQTVPLRNGGEIVVRELSWLDALEFMKLLGDRITDVSKSVFEDPELVAVVGLPEDPAVKEARMRQLITRKLLAQVAEITLKAVDLARWIVEHSLAPEDRPRLKDLGSLDGMKVLRAAVELTLNEDLIREGNAVAGIVLQLMPGKTKTTTNSTPTSPASGANPTSSEQDILTPLPVPARSASSASTPESSPTV